ncbi:hypothetical protein F66182_8490 [Fusarium sp. NRRL 66182]|nr:hypothetical protein F66182_8490 [Fusarium sp. NRRL 66182]
MASPTHELGQSGSPSWHPASTVHHENSPSTAIGQCQLLWSNALSEKHDELFQAGATRISEFQSFDAVQTCSDPTYSALIWGSLLCFSKSNSTLQAIGDQLDHIGKIMPRFDQYIQLYPKHDRLSMALLDIYRHYLDACIQSIKFLRQKSWWRPIFSIMSPVVQSFDNARESIKNSATEFEREARLAHDVEAAGHRESVTQHQKRLEEALPLIRRVSQAKESLFSVPYPRNQQFIGREQDLQLLEDALIGQDQSQRSCAVHGIGGVGKTNLALEFCYRYRQHFNFVLWVSAENEVALSTSYAKIYSLLFSSDTETTQSPLIADTTRRWLCEHPGWLIVFDNVDSDESCLNNFWPPCNHGSIVVTSQTSEWAERTPSIFKLEPLDDDLGSQLLLTHYVNHSSNLNMELVRKISKELDGLPLLLVGLGGFLSKNYQTLDETLDTLKQTSAPLQQFLPDKAPFQYDKPIQRVFELSISRLPSFSKQVISVMAMFAPDDIPESLIMAKPVNERGPFEKSRNWFAVHIRQSLSSRHLASIRRNTSDTEWIYSIHRSVQRSVIDTLSEEERQEAFYQGVTILCRRLPRPSPIMVPHLTGFDSFDKYMPHVLSVHAVYKRYRHMLVPTVAFAEMICSAAAYLYETGLVSHCLEVATTGEAVCQQLVESPEVIERASPHSLHPPDESITFDNVYTPYTHSLESMAGNIIAYGAGAIWVTGGLINRKQGNSMTWKVLKLREQHMNNPGNDQHALDYQHLLSNAYNDWALQLINEGRYSEAKTFSERSLEMKSSLLDDKEHQFQFFISKILLANVLLSQANSTEATAMAQEAIWHVEKEKGANDLFTNHYLYHVANVCSAVGDHDKALSLLGRSLAARVQLFGETHHETLNNHFAVSLCLYRLKRFTEARVHLDRCLKRAKAARWGPEHLIRARYLQSLIMPHVYSLVSTEWNTERERAVVERNDLLKQHADGKWAEPTPGVEQMSSLRDTQSETTNPTDSGRASTYAMDLPENFDPDSLILREATEQEKLQSWRNNSAAWKGKLTVEQYVKQQIINGQQALTRNGRIRYWVYTDGRRLYTSAETLQKRAVVCQPAGEQRETWTFGVAGVFTPAEFRRRGCASSMMKKLKTWLDSEKDCEFTVLWSAVGVSSQLPFHFSTESDGIENFYERFGWYMFDTKEALIPASPNSSGVTSPLSCDQVEQLCDADVQAVMQENQKVARQSDDNVCVTCLPSYAQAEWYFASENYIASVLFNPPSKQPEVKGAISGQCDKIWCYWLHDFNASKLVILRLSIDDGIPSDEMLLCLEHLLQAARSEAHVWGLESVSIWGPSQRVLEASERILGHWPKVLPEIENNIPCLRWKNGRWGSQVVDQVLWQHREMFPWC